MNRLTENKVLDIPMNSNVDDVSGYNLNLTLNGNEKYTNTENNRTYFNAEGSSYLATLTNDNKYQSNNISIAMKLNFSNSATQYIYRNRQDSISILNYSADSGKITFIVNGTILKTINTYNDGRDYNFTFVYDGSTMRIYVDGVLENSISKTGNINYIGQDGIGIFSSQLGAYKFTGKLGSLKQFNVGLTGDEVLTLYKQTTPQLIGIQKPISQVPDLADSSLKGAWLNKKVNMAEDYSLNGNDGIIGENAIVGNGRVEFKGFTNSYINLGKPLNNVTNWTISFWVKPSVVDESISYGSRIMFITNDTTGYNDDVLIGIAPETSTHSTTKRIAVIHQDNITSSRTIVEDTEDAVPNKEYFVVATSDGVDLKLYIDGELKGTTPKTGSFLKWNNANVYIGENTGNGGWGDLDGIEQNIEIYNETKNANWVKNKYLEINTEEDLVLEILDGTKDLSKNNHEIVNHNTIVGNEMNFNGTSSYLTIAKDNILDMGSNDFTQIVWFKSDGVTTQEELLLNGGIGSGGKNSALLIQATGKIWGIIDDNTTHKNTESSLRYDNGGWHSAMNVREGNNLKLYLDGELVDTTDITGYGSITSSKGIIVGTTQNESVTSHLCYFNGKLKDVKIINTAKSADWIKNYYNKTKKYY